jgi:hypothetical protein
MKNRAYKPKKRTKFDQFCEDRQGTEWDFRTECLMAGFDFRYADDIVPNEVRTRNIAGEIEEGRYLKSKVLLSLFKIECEHVKKLEIWEVLVVFTLSRHGMGSLVSLQKCP